MKCSITVGQTTEEFEVPDDLMTAAFVDAQQDRAVHRAGQSFTVAYIAEIGRQRAEKLHPGILEEG